MAKPTQKLARKYDKRLEFFEVILADDGYGGKDDDSLVSIGKRWAYVVNQSERSLAEYRQRYGLNEETYLKVFVIRYWELLDRQKHTFVYLGWIYNILIVNEASEYKTDLEIVAIRVEKASGFAPPTVDNARLLEDGDFRLLEDGDYRLLESA